VFQNVHIPPDLLKIVNSETWFSLEGPSWPVRCLTLTGLATLVALVGHVTYRLASTHDLSGELRNMGGKLKRVFHSTLIVRLCLLQAMMVIPLIFYVNTKEHYWTSKHTTMLFMGFLAICSWLAVRGWVPRFRTPYAWPIALIFLGACLSMFRAVNIAEGMGDLFGIFGAAAFTFLAVQVFSTSKRIHLLALILATVGGIMSLYGLAQAYLLLPTDIVYALDTRAPVSTVGNKNYASYLLDLTIPLTVALAVCRRSPLQTLYCLMLYFICRWEFVLCDTRGGTISLTVGILVTTAMVAIYHGQRFRLLLYLILLEPMMWASVNTASLDYQDNQRWGKMLSFGVEKRAISKALADSVTGEASGLRSYINSWFTVGNEHFLGVDYRMAAIVFGMALAVGVFWWLVTRLSDWRIHLASAAVLAFLPYWFVTFGTMPGNVPATRAAQIVVEGVRGADISNKEIAVQAMQEYAAPLAKAAGPYNQLFLSKHRDVAAEFSLSLFMCLATFLLFRWYDREEGWLPGFAAVGAMGIWFLIYLALRSGQNPVALLIAGLFTPLDHAWPIELQHITQHHWLLGFIFSPFAWAVFSLGGISTAIAAVQFIPATRPPEEAEDLRRRSVYWGKVLACVLAVVVVFGAALHPRTRRVAHAISEHTNEGLVRAIFYGAHAFFNTQGEFKGEAPDNPVGFRLEIYQGTLRKMLDNPILGVGPGNFKIVNPHPKYETSLERRILGKEVLGRHPHNDFMEAATDRGGIALLGLVWIFGIVGLVLFRAMKILRAPRDGTDLFLNTISWGVLWAMTSILVHAQFEMPLLQPSSTYPAWLLFGVAYQIWRIHRRRLLAVSLDSPLLLASESSAQLAERVLGGGGQQTSRNAALYELPPVSARPEWGMKAVPAWISWPAIAVIVPIVMGSVLIRQFSGEMWLRWGMIFSESGVERYDYVFDCMEKSEDIYPQEMETNYILGRYCIDATAKVFKAWQVEHRPDLFTPQEREANKKDIEEIEKTYHLQVDKVIDYAKLGIRVHKRDVFMNPNYKWAHNNMGVLYDKLNQVYETLASETKDTKKKAEYAKLGRNCELASRNCYSTALEIDDLQVYALYNLGHGALREEKVGLARKYFERTLLSDPNRQDVNFFIAKTRFAMSDFMGGIEAIENLYKWSDKRKSNQVEAYQKREIEQILQQVARAAIKNASPETAYRASKVLAERYNRCNYLPIMAHAAANLGQATEALDIAGEALAKCGKKVSAEVVFAQAKAYCLIGNATGAAGAFTTLMKSEVGAAFRDEIKKDPAFDLLRATPVYEPLMKEKESAKATPPSQPKPAAPVLGSPAPVPAASEVSVNMTTATK
jgi:hypothetical protein